ncbi:MAG: glycyl-radical enzyme activating protein [Clostridiales bacterium]|nr:glycyl-radical enzyme activating protein [Clostridiales bacterium]
MQNSHDFGTIFDIQHFSVSDGPGIRTTVFLKGCPLRCQWCHNPESYLPSSQVMFYAEKCKVCGACEEACPAGCHSISGGVHRFNRDACTGCSQCVQRCPTGALQQAGRTMSVDDVIAEVMEDTFFYEHSGGLTLSGGEPMFQPGFAISLAKAAKGNGLHVCLETSGFCKSEYLQQIFPYVDLFLYDYKLTGSEKHKAYTGVSQELILQNLLLLDAMGGQIVLRCPMIPGRNIDDEHIGGICRIAGQLNHLTAIHLEPYHNIGVSKRERLGISENSQMIEPPDRQVLQSIAEAIQTETGINTIIL